MQSVQLRQLAVVTVAHGHVTMACVFLRLSRVTDLNTAEMAVRSTLSAVRFSAII